MNGYLLLGGAICAEIAATTALKATAGFTRLGPSLFVAAGYLASFFLLSHVLRILPLGVTYAIWCAGGIVGTSVLGWIIYGQKLDVPALLGIACIVAGVLIIQLFSTATGH